MRYKLGKTTWNFLNNHEGIDWYETNVAWELPEYLLKEMGATPIDDKPEKHYCSNCMAGSNVVNVPKSQCECDCHEPEKIEKPHKPKEIRPIRIKDPIDPTLDTALEIELAQIKINQIIDWINNHERREE